MDAETLIKVIGGIIAGAGGLITLVEKLYTHQKSIREYIKNVEIHGIDFA